MAQQKAVIRIPKEYGPMERRAISNKIIDLVVRRTQSGKDINNKPFPGYTGKNKKAGKYSAAYTKSLDFKTGGKSKTKINLTLSEEMLNAIEPLSQRSGSVTIGIPGDDKRNNGKAEGNQKGTYGNKRPVTKGRKFIGISQNDLNKILKDFPIKDKETSLEKAARLIAIRKAAEGLASA